MANDLLNPPDADTASTSGPLNGRGPGSPSGSNQQAESGHELDAFLGKAFEEKSVWADLFDNVHDLFFPTKLPPLELTSTPIPVADPMAVKRSPLSIALSTALNLGILALLLFAFRNQIPVIKNINLSGIDVNIAPWKPTTAKPGKMGGGGGG